MDRRSDSRRRRRYTSARLIANAWPHWNGRCCTINADSWCCWAKPEPARPPLLNSVLARRLPNLQIACVPNPKLSFVEIMRVVLPQLGVAIKEFGKLELIQALERAVANRPLGSRTAIIIDEAQNLSDETLEDLRLLSNSCGGQDRELQFVLMGHPELLDRLSARHLRQLRERISTKVTLPALSANESIAYVNYRMHAQNGSARIFEADALKYLVEAAAGVPRRLNVLCHNALLLAYSKNQGTVTLDVAREVVGDYKDIFLPKRQAVCIPNWIASRCPRLPRYPRRSLRRFAGVHNWCWLQPHVQRWPWWDSAASCCRRTSGTASSIATRCRFPVPRLHLRQLQTIRFTIRLQLRQKSLRHRW